MRQLEGYLSITPIAIDDTSDLRGQVDQLSPGNIALFSTDRLGVPLDYLYIGLDPRDDYSEGRRNSINEVGFYDATSYCSGVPLTTQPWAIKPYLTPRAALKDIDTMRHINSLEHTQAIHTFEPKGVIRLEKEVAVITDFIQGVRSCDSLIDEYRGETILPEEKARLIARTAFATMHYFHSLEKPYTMNDAQIKNFAFTISTEPWCIDTETFQQANKDLAKISRFVRDVESCAYSMSGQYNYDGQRMLDPELIIEYFIKPYEKDIPNLYPYDTVDIVQASIEGLKQDIARGA
jgi:hypothetical protein